MRTLLAISFAVLVSMALLAADAQAVAFKLKNDSQNSLRARCYDRGAWREWVQFSPGGWGDFAPGVKRNEHHIEIDVWNGNNWAPLYRNHHGSRLFTRVVQVFSDNGGSLYFAWWDEPPGCRDAPPSPWAGGSTCLQPSGWLWDKMWEMAVKAGQYYVLGGG